MVYKIGEILGEFFGLGDENYQFKYFSIEHLLPILIMFLLIFLLVKYGKKVKNFKYEERLRYYIAAFLIFLQMSANWQDIYIGTANIQRALPFQLCSMGMILSGFMLMIKSQYLFDMLYFWIICGSINALITPTPLVHIDRPDLGPMNFRYYQFFLGHIGIVLVIFYMIFVLNYKVTLRSLKRSLIWLNIFAAFVIFVNLNLGSNYLFLNGNEEAASALDFFPPFPYNLIVFEFLAITIFSLAYLPWYLKKRKSLSMHKNK